MSLARVHLSKNNWQTFEDLGSSSESQIDLDSVDIRKFTRATCSQLETAHAVDKTLKKAFKHQIHDSNSLNAMSSTDNLFDEVQKVTTPAMSYHLATLFWESFHKYAVQPVMTSKVRAMSLPVERIRDAMAFISHDVSAEKLRSTLASLGIGLSESLCWREYKNLCYRLFLQNFPTKSSSTPNLGVRREGSPSRANTSDRVLSFDVLMRKERASTSSALDTTSVVREDSTVFKPDLPPLKKDILCNVLKEEYRKIRKAMASGAEPNIIEQTPHFMTDIQKTKVAGMVDRRQLRPVKRLRVKAQRAREKSQISRHAERQELLKNLKTVVVAQDRTATNKSLIAIEEAHQNYIEANMDNRYVETQTTKRNIDFWKRNSHHIRTSSALDMKHVLRESSAEAKKIYADEKCYRKFCLSEQRGDLSRTLSLHTSSKFDVPLEIQNRIKYSKRYSEWQKARNDAKLSYENEMSSRINTYTSARQTAKARADAVGCKVSVNPIIGSEYFQEDGDSMYYFDSASFVEYPEVGPLSAIKSAPVFLDPNYALFHNRSKGSGDGGGIWTGDGMTDSWASEASCIPYPEAHKRSV